MNYACCRRHATTIPFQSRKKVVYSDGDGPNPLNLSKCKEGSEGLNKFQCDGDAVPDSDVKSEASGLGYSFSTWTVRDW
ncbi:hypothetical protein TNCT_18271 [Trichonephila clavata]|uniref:Uncharacterized protein n=1 Tax=Trichonephila clavata TaxID=2740835 RepID=A0A8X6IB19_TRICU|nr:hypothetical protein TNCT_18271 [Trichonephila clavata]